MNDANAPTATLSSVRSCAVHNSMADPPPGFTVLDAILISMSTRRVCRKCMELIASVEHRVQLQSAVARLHPYERPQPTTSLSGNAIYCLRFRILGLNCRVLFTLVRWC